jgi:hypothetical protein
MTLEARHSYDVTNEDGPKNKSEWIMSRYTLFGIGKA